MDQLEAMRVFVVVADLGSFSAAARKLGVSVSSATRAVDALEADLGARLVRRSTRSLRLTDAGQTYYAQAAKILQDVDLARTLVADLDSAPRGTLRVHAPVALGRRHLAPLLPPLLARHPGLQIDLTLSDQVVNLLEANVDVAIRLGGLEDSTLIARRLVPNRRVLCASPRYLAGAARIERPRDLSGHACLLFAYAEADRTWRFRRGGRVEEVRVRGRLRANNSEVLLEAAVAGVGVALLPEWLAAADLAAGRVVHVLPEFEASPGDFDGWVLALFTEPLRRSPKVRSFVDYLAVELPKCLPTPATPTRPGKG